MQNSTGENHREINVATKEREHELLQNTLDEELNELNKRLEQKEVWAFVKDYFCVNYWTAYVLHFISLCNEVLKLTKNRWWYFNKPRIFMTSFIFYKLKVWIELKHIPVLNLNQYLHFFVQSEIRLFGGLDTETLKQHFGRKILELEEEKRIVQVWRTFLNLY